VNDIDDPVPFGTRLTQITFERPDEVAVISVAPDGGERVLTFSQMESGANRWARELGAAGAALGSHVALVIPNSIELVLAAHGCWKVGAVPIPVRWDLPAWERSRLLDVIGAAVVIDEGNCSAFVAAASRHPDSAVPEAVTPTVYGICSSGSTGMPKVILDTQPAIWTSLKTKPFMSVWRPVPRPQIILVPAPMYHTNGFNALFSPLAGDRLVVLEKFSGELVLDMVEKHRITNFTATPTMLARIARVPGVEQRDVSSIDWIMQGAAVMPVALLETWFKLLSPEQILMAYGMTENFGIVALRGDEWLNHRGSTGRGFRDTEIKILDPDGREVPTGELGEIYMRSPVREIYRYIGGAPPLPCTPDGFHTGGDIGRVDADGYLYVIDRRVDMIVTGGANVFPAEVEAALAEHDDIADVVVLGLKDAEWGRRVHAVVQPTDLAHLTQQRVIDYAKSKLAPYKVPKTVEFVAEIPRSAATKVSRSAMVEARGG
jgi:bile acid-coenzyme A ligase